MFGKQVRTITIDEQGNVTDIDDGSIVKRQPSKWDNVWSFFYAYAHGATVGGNEWEAKSKRKTHNDNGREYNSATGNWEYTAEANRNANPCQCNYEAPQDYQGSVPVWDGYDGE
jgi:hypothetical protein